jgi:small nuclear ribonucleoprotein (snRNP)-like protein
MASRRSPPSLVALLEAVEGHKLMFELHNDATISGRLASVDQQMKCGKVFF